MASREREVAALHRVVEETVNRVAVVLIVLGGVDTALGRDGVGAARAVLDTEVEHVETELAESGGSRSACQTRTDHDYIEVALVGGVHEFLMCLIVGPFFSYGTFGNF